MLETWFFLCKEFVFAQYLRYITILLRSWNNHLCSHHLPLQLAFYYSEDYLRDLPIDVVAPVDSIFSDLFTFFSMMHNAAVNILVCVYLYIYIFIHILKCVCVLVSVVKIFLEYVPIMEILDDREECI